MLKTKLPDTANNFKPNTTFHNTKIPDTTLYKPTMHKSINRAKSKDSLINQDEQYEYGRQLTDTLRNPSMLQNTFSGINIRSIGEDKKKLQEL